MGLTTFPSALDSFAAPSVGSLADIANSIANLQAAMAEVQGILGTTAEGCGIKPFYVRQSLTSAAAATPVSLLPASAVPDGKAACLCGGVVFVSGSTAWTDLTATKITVQDTAGTPAVFCDIAKALLVGDAVVSLVQQSDVTFGLPFKRGEGGGNGQGIDVVADANFAAGSDIMITLWGVIRSS